MKSTATLAKRNTARHEAEAEIALASCCQEAKEVIKSDIQQ